MSQEAFSKIIYDNFLFDVPKILDMCALYHNNPLLIKLVENLFALQPNYYKDFKKCIPDMVKVTKLKALGFFQRLILFHANIVP